MKGYYIRLFATDTQKTEVNGKAWQSDFSSEETRTVWVRQVMAFMQAEGDVFVTPAGRRFSVPMRGLHVEIQTRAVDYSEYSQIEDLEAFLSRKFVYLATRWEGQGDEGKYPRAIPAESAKAMRLAIQKIETRNDEGLLRLVIEGWTAKWD